MQTLPPSSQHLQNPDLLSHGLFLCLLLPSPELSSESYLLKWLPFTPACPLSYPSILLPPAYYWKFGGKDRCSIHGNNLKLNASITALETYQPFPVLRVLYFQANISPWAPTALPPTSPLALLPFLKTLFLSQFPASNPQMPEPVFREQCGPPNDTPSCTYEHPVLIFPKIHWDFLFSKEPSITSLPFGSPTVPAKAFNHSFPLKWSNHWAVDPTESYFAPKYVGSRYFPLKILNLACQICVKWS